MPEKRRVRFVECRLESQAKGVRARVVLADPDGATYTGLSQGERDADPDLWHAAGATVDALRQALELGQDAITLRAVVAFQIGDHPAVAVELRTLADGKKRRLHGLCQAEDDRPRAAALAVMSATNRFFSEA